MKNMVILVDTNILLNYLTNHKERRQNLRDICEIVSVATASKSEIIDVINRDFLLILKIRKFRQ